MKTIGDVLREGKARLLSAGVPEAQVDIEWLLEHVTGIKRLELSLCRDRQISVEEEEVLSQLMLKRCQRVPLQHLIGSVSFLGYDIMVGAGALIPRPETESLAELVLREIERWEVGRLGRVLDIGTGTGCLSVAIAAARENIEVIAIDVSVHALAIASENVRAHRLEGKIRLIESDLFAEVPDGGGFDLIVSNPPYIPRAEIQTLQEEVRDHDPHLALDGGIDGLEFYRSIAADTRSYLRGSGMAYLEFGDGQQDEIRCLFEHAGWQFVNWHRDLNDKLRFIEVRV